MFCPRCGNEDHAAAGPCASCKLALEPIRRFLVESASGNRRKYRAALGAGGLVAAVVLLAILWIIFFAVGEVSAEAFLPFLVVLTWLAAVILLVHLAVARWQRERVGELSGTA